MAGILSNTKFNIWIISDGEQTSGTCYLTLGVEQKTIIFRG